MMKRALCFLPFAFALLIAIPARSQQYFTREGKVAFFSETPMENIEAFNSKASSVWDAGSGQVEFAVLIKAFQFEKALMQEHFNENYMESSEFPKAAFKGKMVPDGKIDLKKDGTYAVTAKGDLTIHGVTRQVEAPGTIVVKDGAVSARSVFEVAPDDYGIAIPAVVRENIAKSIRIEVEVDYELFTRGS